MTHRSVLSKIVIDVAEQDHDRALEFWEAAIGQSLPQFTRYPEYHGASLTTSGMGLLVQRIGEGGSRVHLDIHADDVEAEVARLEALGAATVERREHWTVMRDPAGLLFCVVIDHRLDETNSHVWES